MCIKILYLSHRNRYIRFCGGRMINCHSVVEEYRRMLGLFGVSGDLALQQVLLKSKQKKSELIKKKHNMPFSKPRFVAFRNG